MTWNNRRCLLRNKGHLVYNYKIKKFEHMSETPMWYDYKCLQNIRKGSLKNVLKYYFIYYSRVSVIEGLNTELPIYKLMLGNYDKEVYW